MQALRVAALQMRSGPEPGPNLDALEALVDEAAAAGAGYVLSPEVTVAFAENRGGLARVTGPAEADAGLARVAGMARRHRLVLHLGSLAVALEDGRFANRSIVFGPDGAVLASYDKIHLFDATLPGVKAYRESDTYRGGDRAVVVEAGRFRLGLTICYDLRFAALYRALAEAGAEVLAVPAAFTVPTGRAHWEVLLRARAIETGCYVVAAAQGGLHPNGRATWGHSMIVDPWGEVVAGLEGDAPGVLIADLDLARIAEARARVPALANARAFSLSVNDIRPQWPGERKRLP
jgi:predicted amidohydrolase